MPTSLTRERGRSSGLTYRERRALGASVTSAGASLNRASSQIARTTGSSPARTVSPAARSALRDTKYDVPWRRVVLRYLNPHCPTLSALYRGMGWSESQAYTRRRFPHLQLRIAAQMGQVLQVPNLARFLFEMAHEEGIPPANIRVIQKPEAQKLALRRRGSSRRCTECGARDHESPCPNRTEHPAVRLIKDRSLTHPKRVRQLTKRTRVKADDR